MFDTAKRGGYERRQVDQAIEELTGQVRAAVTRAETAERHLAQAVEDERAGFGGRMENLMRMAEREAAEIRVGARDEADQILEQARAQAQAREAEATEALAVRRAEIDEAVNRSRRDLETHQKAMCSEIAAAHREAENLRTRAEADAAATLEKAHGQLRNALLAVEQATAEHRERTQSEIGQLLSTHDNVCDELARLHDILADVGGDLPEARPDSTPEAPAGHNAATPDIVHPRQPSEHPEVAATTTS